MPINFNLSDFRKEHNLDTFFETGLYMGVSLRKAINAGFTRGISVEISSKHIANGNKTFSKEIEEGKVFLIKDDSKNIEKHLSLTVGNTFYWLDAHADQGGGHEQGTRCPLYHELNAIKKVIKPNDIIAIDDMRIIKGGSWGSEVRFPKILELIKEIGDYDIQFMAGFNANDVLVATPISIP